jgi:hypothetical protein
MNDEHRVFKVTIHGFKGVELRTKNDKPASHPIINVLWDNHHKFHTHKGDGPNARWKDSFEFVYETRRLNATVTKELRLDCIVKSLTSHVNVGSVKVPLIDVLNGPQHFELTLKDGAHLGGKIKFVCTATQICKTFMSLIQCKTSIPPQILETVRALTKSKGGDVYVLQYGFLNDVEVSPVRDKKESFKSFKVTEGIQPNSEGGLEWSSVPPISVEIDSLKCYTGKSGLCLQLCAFPRSYIILLSFLLQQ